MSQSKQVPLVRAFRNTSATLIGLLACMGLSGCMVAGFSSGGSGGAGFIWPGGLGLVFVLLAVLWFLLRRR